MSTANEATPNRRDRVNVQSKITPERYRRWQDFAKSDDRTVASLVRVAVEEYIEAHANSS